MIKIVDSVMGSGKTNWAIQYMNDNIDRKFIYITPYNKEISNRIIPQCPELEFKMGRDGRKTMDFIEAIECGENVIGTHEVLKRLPDSIMETIKDNGYTLILDESLSVLKDIEKLNADDIEFILEKLGKVDETGRFTWTNENYEGGQFDAFRKEAETGKVYLHDGKMFIWLFPPYMFDCFEDVYVMTYMFSWQYFKYYLDLHDKSYEMFKVDKGCLVSHDGDFGHNFAQYIEVYEGPLNSIGDKGLTYTWYTDKRNCNSRGTAIGNNIRNFFRKYKVKAEDAMWTTFKDTMKDKDGNIHTVKPNGFVNEFVPCNTRASNDWEHKHYLAYCIDHRPRPKISNVYLGGIAEQEWALADMLQWIWRSAIRREKPEKIVVYIPSKRMRTIFKQWLDNELVGIAHHTPPASPRNIRPQTKSL